MPPATSRGRVRLAWLPQQGVPRERNGASVGPGAKPRPAVDSPCASGMFPQGALPRPPGRGCGPETRWASKAPRGQGPPRLRQQERAGRWGEPRRGCESSTALPPPPGPQTSHPGPRESRQNHSQLKDETARGPRERQEGPGARQGLRHTSRVDTPQQQTEATAAGSQAWDLATVSHRLPSSALGHRVALRLTDPVLAGLPFCPP